MQAAQRFPDDWDGILVGAPSNNETGYIASVTWNLRTWVDDPQGRIPAGKLASIQRAALASCTAQAHVLNGIAADPRFCPFDPEILSCKGPETNECLTKYQVTTLRKIYSGPRNPRTGEQIYPGYPPTGESAWAGHITAGVPIFVFEPEYGSAPLGNLRLSNIFCRYVFDNPQWNVRLFDFDRSITLTENKTVAGMRLSSLLNATNPDLSPLWKRGSKVLMYFGWGDQAITPLGGIAYYENVAQVMGGIDKAQDSFRLFMVPGMTHCAGGPGANSFGQGALAGPALGDDPTHSAMRALEAWVETGRKPDRIIAAKYVDDDPQQGVAFTRPLCPYPEIAIYKGAGSVTDASNFECKRVAPR